MITPNPTYPPPNLEPRTEIQQPYAVAPDLLVASRDLLQVIDEHEVDDEFGWSDDPAVTSLRTTITQAQGE